MGGQRKDLKYDIDSGFIEVTDRGPRVEESSSDDEPEYPNKPRDPNGLASLPAVGEAASMVDMEPVQSRTLDAESKQRALWPFKPPNPGRKWENSCSTSTGQYQDTQYDEQPKRHDKRRYARLAPRESLESVPERSSSPEAPNTPASSPRREDEDAHPTGEVKRKAEWVGNSLDLTWKTRRTTRRLGQRTRRGSARRRGPRDETRPPWTRSGADAASRAAARGGPRRPARAAELHGQSPPAEAPEPEQRPTRRHLVNAPGHRGATRPTTARTRTRTRRRRSGAARPTTRRAATRRRIRAAIGLAVSRSQAAGAPRAATWPMRCPCSSSRRRAGWRRRGRGAAPEARAPVLLCLMCETGLSRTRWGWIGGRLAHGVVQAHACLPLWSLAKSAVSSAEDVCLEGGSQPCRPRR